MDGMVVAFFVPTVIFLTFVAPIWIFMHYRSKQRAQGSLSEAEREEMEVLKRQADRMIERLQTLESILDAQTPEWRKRAWGSEAMSRQRYDGPDDAGPFEYGTDEHAAPRDDDWAPRTRRLCLDPRRRRIAGVCAGIARYYAMEPWVVRLIAITALLFLPGIVFPAYWVAYFVMERPAGEYPSWSRVRWAQMQARGRRGHRHRGRRSQPRDEYSSPAPELGPRISPRRGLRDVQADLTEVELRLRRMEAHVTSGRYELQRELHAIDNGATR